MRNGRVSKSNSFLIMFSLLALSRSIAQAAVPGVTADSVKIGQVAVTTGPAALEGQGEGLKVGTLAAFTRINNAGGVFNRKLELLSQDDQYDPLKALEIYRKSFNGGQVLALLNVYGAGENSMLAPIIAKDDIPLLGAITVQNMSEPLQKNIFAVRLNSEIETRFLVEHAVEDLKVNDFGVFYQDDALGKAGLSAATKALGARGIQISVGGSYVRNTSHVDSAAAAFLAKRPKAILLYSLATANVALANKLAASGYKPVYLGGAAANGPLFIKAVTAQGLEFFCARSFPSVADESFEIVKNFRTDMNVEKFKEHPFAFEGYVNAMVFAEGLKRAGSDLTRESLRKGLESLKNFNVGGLKVSYSNTDHQGFKSPFLSKVIGGKMVTVSNFATNAEPAHDPTIKKSSAKTAPTGI